MTGFGGHGYKGNFIGLTAFVSLYDPNSISIVGATKTFYNGTDGLEMKYQATSSSNASNTQPTNMRRTFNVLSVLVRNKLIENPLTGQLFVFFIRRRTHVSGYCIWMKRSEQGQFCFNARQGNKMTNCWTKSQRIISGIDMQKVTKYKRYNRAKVLAKTV